MIDTSLSTNLKFICDSIAGRPASDESASADQRTRWVLFPHNNLNISDTCTAVMNDYPQKEVVRTAANTSPSSNGEGGRYPPRWIPAQDPQLPPPLHLAGIDEGQDF